MNTNLIKLNKTIDVRELNGVEDQSITLAIKNGEATIKGEGTVEAIGAFIPFLVTMLAGESLNAANFLLEIVQCMLEAEIAEQQETPSLSDLLKAIGL